jgi:ornithine cyclodeaminase
MPVAIIDGSILTSLRTAGHAAVGAAYLARSGSSRLAVIGCGVEGRTHVDAFLSQFPAISEVFLYDTDGAAASKLAEHVGAQNKDARVCPTVQEAVRTSDIICVVTTAPMPIVFSDWVKPGAHLCAATGFRDVDYTVAKSFDKWVVGFRGRDLDWISGAELGRIGGLSKGQLSEDDIYGDLAVDIIPGRLAGREDDVERTVMTHMGMPSLDVGVAVLAFERARLEGKGQHITLF